MDRIDLFRVFARVVECASFTRAAATLDLPRSSVSAAVQELEARMGARLLHRTTRKVAPSQDGAALYERCLRLIADVEEVEGLFSGSAAGPSGRIKVDVPGRIGRLLVTPALPAFLERYPGIEVELGVTDRAVDLIEESVDCVVRVGALSDSTLVARPIGELALVNLASPAYLARHGTPRTPADLQHHLAVGYASPSTGRREDWEWLEGGELRQLSLRSRVTVNGAEAYIASCLAGLGLIQLPAYDAAAHLAAGELVAVLPDHRAPPMPMTLLYPHRRHLAQRVRALIDWLEELLRRAVQPDAAVRLPCAGADSA